jgi:hypothetical protein
MDCFFWVVHGGSAISPENRDPIFPDRAQKPEILSCLSMISAGNRFPLFRIMLGTSGSKKEARPKGPGTPYALRRNIFRKHQKTMACLAFG